MKSHLLLDDFTARTGLRAPNISSGEITTVVALRDIAHIENLIAMPLDYLHALLRNVNLEGDIHCFPYKDAVIEMCRIDPRTLLIGQTFVERPKYQRLIENLNGLFDGFCTTRGFAKCTAYIVIGRLTDGTWAIAHYIPPLIEVHGDLKLIDGIHRNYVTGSIGTTIESIVLKHVPYPPPCDFGPWSKISVVDVKPPREERFLNLDTSLFRNLGWAGIDG